MLYVLIGIIFLFFMLLAVKSLLKLDICVICASISLTWLGLLTLYYLGLFEDPLLLALLMGQSITGIFYLLDAKVPEYLKVFRLPFILTLTVVAYMAITLELYLESIFLMVSLWIFFAVLLILRDKQARGVVAKIIECCKNW